MASFSSRHSRAIYLTLVAATAVSTCVVGYYAYRAARRFHQLGEQSIVQSTYLLVREKIDRVEEHLIRAELSAMEVVRQHPPEVLTTVWDQLLPELTPTVAALAVLDEARNVLGFVERAGIEVPSQNRRVFYGRLRRELDTSKLAPGELKHLHVQERGRYYLVAYRVEVFEAQPRILVVLHDTTTIIEQLFPSLVQADDPDRLTNVETLQGQTVYGDALRSAGDYVVGLRFPTTLYDWRLQIAPRAAHELVAEKRTRRVNEVALIAASLAVLLLGVLFLIYAAEAQRRLSMLKSDFVANVSHELKTPLSGIRIFVDLLSNQRASEAKQAEYLAIIRRETERLTTLIEGLLDFSALEQGKAHFERVPIEVTALCQRALQTLQPQIDSVGAAVTLTLPEHELWVLGDADALGAATVNLLDNALKYAPTAPIVLSASLEGEWVHVSVRDQGPGVPEQLQRRIFERFYRSPRALEVRGSGIGLALVREIVRKHNGRVSVHSNPGQGATFTLRVPLLERGKRRTDGTLAEQPHSH